jgi:hypothetical protein
MTVVFTIFALVVGLQQPIPFRTSLNPFYGERNTTSVDKAARKIELVQVVVKTTE